MRIVAGVIVALLLLNGVAFMHAWRMTHYVAAGVTTRKPEELNVLDKVLVLVTGVTIPRPANRRTPADEGLPYATERFSASDGVGLEAWRVPAAAPLTRVLMFHGYKGAKAGLLREARVLHDLNCEVVLVDQRGSGGSDGSVTSVGWFEALDVAAAAAREKRDLPLYLLGNSMGAAAVLRAISRHDAKASGLILQAPFDRMLSTVRNRFNTFGLFSFPFAEMLVAYGGWQQGFDAFQHNPVDYAAGVTVPTLMMGGQNDRRATAAQMQGVFAALKGARHFVQFPSVGHDNLLKSDPHRWRAAVASFIGGTRKFSGNPPPENAPGDPAPAQYPR